MTEFTSRLDGGQPRASKLRQILRILSGADRQERATARYREEQTLQRESEAVAVMFGNAVRSVTSKERIGEATVSGIIRTREELDEYLDEEASI